MRRFLISVLMVAMLVAGFSFQGPVSHAQVRREYDIGALGLGQLLRRLQTTASAMHTGAHPDDEDSSLISRLARGDSARVSYLSLNRGEGGQNIIGPELLEPLGVIRTEELLQARKLDGGTQLFTRTFDYGFSKTREEAASKWNEQLVLGDVVRAIRMFRPLVIISRFTGTKADGHGQHQFAGYITPLAFKAAADPKAFPEQIAEGLYPWQAKKLYVGQSFGENIGNVPTLRIQTGAEDPLIGRTYFEIAAEGRSQHKTQEMGMIEMRGPQSSGIRLVQSSVPIKREEISVFDDIDTSITGIRTLAGLPEGVIDRDLEEMQKSAGAALSSYTAFNPRSIIPGLAEGLTATRSARAALAGFQGDRAARAAADSLLDEKERQFSESLERAAGVVMDALANSETIAAGETLEIAVKIYLPESSTLKVNEVKVIGPTSWKFETAPEPAASQDQIFRFFREKPQSSSFFNTTVPMDAPLSQPYWLARPRRGAMFDWPKGTTKNLPFDGPLLMAEAQTEIGGVKVTVSRPVQFRYADNIRGEIRRDVNVVPKVVADLDTSVIVVPTSDAVQTRKLTVRLVNNSQTPLKGEVLLAVPTGWQASPSSRPLGLSKKGEQASTTFELTVPKNASPGAYHVEARAVIDGMTYNQQMQTIAYPHISTHRIYSPADALVQVVDLKVANIKVGYIAGSGDQVPEAIEQMGVPVTMLGEAELSTGDLSRFDTIVVGVRASEVRPDFVTNNKRLFEFVNGGGTLIVQYQRPDYVIRGLQPYAAKIGSPGAGPRVTDEDAPVKILQPEHPAFNFPNKITQADWQGWVLERTVFNFTNFDPRYTPLLESHDPGEGDETGGEVVAEIGKGRYVYTSYAWFRQLPAGVPGAYRLFANLISLSKAPKPNMVSK